LLGVSINYKKVKFANLNQMAEPVEPVALVPAVKKTRKPGGKKKVEKPDVVAKTPPKKPAKKQAKKTAKPELKKPLEAKAEKPKKAKAIAGKAKKVSGRKPGVKAVAKAPKVTRKTPVPKKQKPIARKDELVKRGDEAFLFATRQQWQIEEMERVISKYERMFEAVRQLFNREMGEVEDLVAGLLV
jgi:hypothetical protein